MEISRYGGTKCAMVCQILGPLIQWFGLQSANGQTDRNTRTPGTENITSSTNLRGNYPPMPLND